ncbi:hypothetical protein BMR1_03g04315 [Babesia microti strain RI]|uniref:Uncharacterized protein n=1 Tax=Babesia microti (strain RI) TaxID=1133968 RepID=A0A0K3APQ9_BABMR|nr:hypothetical protein BMR1_03g04315 [Babesia microti strain RI]CTQ41462.1 hypothetical protein BMR1_03g04315 [Babesia microti strain RI]|eukprot:XP_012649473.1 hypothetical protein BMR1_03g04315 [Babesia microti strain RI]
MIVGIFSLSQCNASYMYINHSLFQIRNLTNKNILSGKTKKVTPKIVIKGIQYNFVDKQKGSTQNYESVYSYLTKINNQRKLDKLMDDSKINYINAIARCTKNYFKSRVIYEGPRNIIFWRRMKRPGKRS